MKKKITKSGKIAIASALAIALTLGTISVTGITGCGSDQTEVSAKEAPPDGGPGGTPPDGAPGGAPPDGASGGAPGGAPGADASNISWSGATEITDSGNYSDKTYSSTTADQNALLVTGNATFDGITVEKSGDGESGDAQSFYGTNSGIMVKDGAKVTIKNATINTSANGANGVFSYGGSATTGNSSSDGTTVTISDSKISTTGDGSGGIMTTGGGITKASNLTVNTSGRSSAAIRTDRGGGTVTVDGGTYTTSGMGSPTIYSTADITVSNATLTSNTSEGVCIEGTNSVTLNNCNLTASNNRKNGNAQYLDSIMIYQSFSGDAAGTGSQFTMKGGTLNSKSGHVFHVTNTNATINLNDVSINNSDSEDVLLSVVNDGWSGTDNKATVNATSQNLSGKIIVSNTASSASSSSSSLTLNLDSASTFTGSIGDENGSGSALGTVDVTLDGVWTLTADSYVTSISGSGIIDYNGHTLYVGGTAYTSGSPGGSITNGSVSKETVTAETGYQIQYSTSKSFKKKTTKTVTKKQMNRIIKTLKNKKKTYYYRTRTYETVNGKTTYGKWSKKKKC